MIEREAIRSVIDWGCGDGGQLALVRLPAAYVGVDISRTAVAKCRTLFPSRRFAVVTLEDDPPKYCRGELGLSMDVIFHLVKDHDFKVYLRRLFSNAERFVCIYGTDYDEPQRAHMRHRHFTPYVGRYYPGWQLCDRPSKETGTGFFLYARR